jgi:hypothetical protein
MDIRSCSLGKEEALCNKVVKDLAHLLIEVDGIFIYLE